MAAYRIITDSSCDLTQEMADALGLQIAPLSVNFKGNSDVMELRKIGKQTYVAAVYRRRVEYVKREETLVFALADPHSRTGGKLLGYNWLVIY